MQGPYLRRYGSSDPVYFTLYEPDGSALVAGVTSDTGSDDFQISKDGGAFADIAGTLTDETRGAYSYTPATGADWTCKCAVITLIDIEAVALDASVIVETYGHPDAMHPWLGIPGLDLGTMQGASQLRSGGVLANDQMNGAILHVVAGTGLAQSRVIADSVDDDNVTLDPAAVTAFDSTSKYYVHPAPPAPQSTLPRSDVRQWLGTTVATPGTAGVPSVDTIRISTSATAADNAETALTGGSYNVGGGAVVAASVTGAVGSVTGAVGSVTAGVTLANDAITAAKFDESTAFPLTSANGSQLTEAGGDGDHLTAINLPNQTMDIVGNITGNLSGSVGSVSGAVGSVTAEVEANVKKVNDVTLTGTGTTGDEWGPV